jgi:Zn-dependent M28 family amino/carboxypeptidase
VVEPLRIHNVLGIVEGRDGRHRDEVVVVGAHLDHDGIDEDGQIYPGADDNASGTAAVMAAAAAFAQAAAHGERPARAVLFALWNAEEKGANINLDMVGRREEVPDPEDWRFSGFPKIDAASSANTLHVLGYSYTPELAADIRRANAVVGLALKEDYDVGAQGLLHRSDQWPFLRRGIPAVFLTTGLHPDYHTPSDEPARIDFGKLERVARLAARAAWIVADGKAPRMTRPEAEPGRNPRDTDK